MAWLCSRCKFVFQPAFLPKSSKWVFYSNTLWSIHWIWGYKLLNSLNASFHHIETSQLLCFYMMATLAFNELIGDQDYPFTLFCMTEFQTRAANKHVRFNNMLRSARNQVESAFSRLKARWTILTKPVYLKLGSLDYLFKFCIAQFLPNVLYLRIGCKWGKSPYGTT